MAITLFCSFCEAEADIPHNGESYCQDCYQELVLLKPSKRNKQYSSFDDALDDDILFDLSDEELPED